MKSALFLAMAGLAAAQNLTGEPDCAVRIPPPPSHVSLQGSSSLKTLPHTTLRPTQDNPLTPRPPPPNTDPLPLVRNLQSVHPSRRPRLHLRLAVGHRQQRRQLPAVVVQHVGSPRRRERRLRPVHRLQRDRRRHRLVHHDGDRCDGHRGVQFHHYVRGDPDEHLLRLRLR